MLRSTIVFFIVSLASSTTQCVNGQSSGSQGAMKITKTDSVIQVNIGDELFTAYNYKEVTKPFLYPVLGPGQIRMTRDFPMKETEGEANDHPHHQSIWIGHEISGVDFWKCGGGAKIEVVGDPKIDDESQSISATCNWINGSGKTICSDTTKWSFGCDENSRWIDCEFSIKASEGPISIDDTKEGTVAIRTHPDLRLKPDPKRGVGKVFGNAVNSQGTTGTAVWGEAASWVLYSGNIDSKPASLLILDHPDNFRSPTTWHAREYGLIGANPFGLHYFQKLEKGVGAVQLLKGQSVTLKYRFVFANTTLDSDAAAKQMSAFRDHSTAK